jgi:hypothetical protein
LCDRRRYLALRRKQVRHLAIVLLAPKQFVVSHIDKFNADREVVADLGEPTGHHRIHA